MLRRPRPPGNHDGVSLWRIVAAILPLLPLAPLAAAVSPGPAGQQDGLQDASPDRLVLDIQQIGRFRDTDSFIPWPAVATAQGPNVVRRSSFSSNNNNNNNNHHRDNNRNIIHKRHYLAQPSDDVRALTTLAPANAVRAPPRTPAEVSLLPEPRTLDGWEVEEFVLLATVDGDLVARERHSGREIWRINTDQPMVQTTHYHPANQDSDPDDYSNWIWAIEPAGDGAVYMWDPASGAGLMKTGFSMKKLVEQMAPYKSEGPAVVYTGSKKTMLMTINAGTGQVSHYFGTESTPIDPIPDSCTRLSGFDQGECASGTITLGRTEYTVEVQRYGGRPIATLKYTEWVPNNYDRDLVQQYQGRLQSLDGKYMTTDHQGKLIGRDFSHLGKSDRGDGIPLFGSIYNGAAVRVFDVCRPLAVNANPELVILPQPVAPYFETEERIHSVVINRTAAGGWYAMSGIMYPLIVSAPVARAELAPADARDPSRSIPDYLIGKHYVDRFPSRASTMPLLPAPPETTILDLPGRKQILLRPSSPLTAIEQHLPPNLVETVKTLPQRATHTIIDFFKNPMLFICAVVFLYFKQSSYRRWWRKIRKDYFSSQSTPTSKEPVLVSDEEPAIDVVVVVKDPVPDALESFDVSEAPATSPETITIVPTDELSADLSLEPPAEAPAEVILVEFEPPEEPNKAELAPTDSLVDQPADPVAADGADPPPEKKKKKAHRGRRAGAAHKKKNKVGVTLSESPEEPAPGSVEAAVNNAKKLGLGDQVIRPHVQSMEHNMESVRDDMFRMGNMEVDTGTQLGTGSNGTQVFAGKFAGRDIAVKRMLVQFYDIASQETRLLKESDDHPNVIRYYEQQVLQPFLYIALERCAASLADVIEKPHMYREIAEAGAKDMRDVLYQICSGICHLHKLRIVHRDLKPHNILIKMGKDGRPCLKVSDFGLCKKLEGTQSSFGATTGRAAGTIGWRAPELLLDDDAGQYSSQQGENSTDGGSGSIHVGLHGEAQGLTNRRATRSIDVFSLGLVFFYVLTEGQHPFDCGDRYMREVNIRKGNYSLRPLERLGEWGHEAQDLIGRMIRANPKERISAPEVLAHPFFWDSRKRLAFLCDVSDGFEKEVRDPPSDALMELENHSRAVIRNCDFLRQLPKEFVDSLGRQRKYMGSRMLDLLRALRNKKNHYEEMPDSLKRTVGGLRDGGYLDFWVRKFPNLLLVCWEVVKGLGWEGSDRFRDYYPHD